MKSRVGQLLSFYFINESKNENETRAIAPHVTSSAVTEKLLQTAYKRIV
jgi:hypothetical protein